MASTSAEPKMYSATYVENYLDSVENLPNDVQRYLTRIREIDLQCRGKIRFYFALFIPYRIRNSKYCEFSCCSPFT